MAARSTPIARRTTHARRPARHTPAPPAELWPVTPRQLRGLALHLEVFFSEESDGQQPEAPPGVSSADAGSHWANVFVLLEPTEVREGATLLVRTTAELGGATPQYSFKAWLGEGEAGREAPPETMRCLGEVTYP